MAGRKCCQATLIFLPYTILCAINSSVSPKLLLLEREKNHINSYSQYVFYQCFQLALHPVFLLSSDLFACIFHNARPSEFQRFISANTKYNPPSLHVSLFGVMQICFKYGRTDDCNSKCLPSLGTGCFLTLISFRFYLIF